MTQTENTQDEIRMIDIEPSQEQFLSDLLEGLSQPQKTVPAKYLYDERGSALFDQICELPEYYLTRTELAIMREHGEDMAQAIGEHALVVELGSGSSLKTRLLLDRLKKPAGYVPVDISREHLADAAQALSDAYPHVEVLPVCADYMTDFDVPLPSDDVERRVAYFPGSTIGNMHLPEAESLLARLSKLCGKGGQLLIGVDMKKDPKTLEAAYNDAAEVTAEFNFNLLKRINRELEGDIDETNFEFRAVWNEDKGRVESYLISSQPQTIHLGDETIELEAGERIRTECSYKFTIDEFAQLARRAGWSAEQHWMDNRERFSVMLCSR